MCESSQTRCGVGLDVKAKLAVFFAVSRTICGEVFGRGREFNIRADTGRFFESEAFSLHRLLRREMRSLRPPYPLFLEKISCLAGFLGETGDSGLNPGLGGMST